jgi:ubiquinone/menaquinone biosynthesis C-methylase UbiE
MSFNEKAASWDDESRIKRAGIIADEIRRTVPLEKTWTGLEFGCGTGLISFNLVRELKKITMIDVAEGMIEVCLNKIRSGGFGTVRALNTGIETLLEHGEQFDIIYSSMALHHVADTEGMIRKFKRALSCGGTVCIVDLNSVDSRFHESEPGFDGHNGFDQEELKGMLQSNGFQFCESHTFYSDTKRSDGEPVEFSLFIMTGRLKA